jgi:hypothetical protein
MTALFVGPPNPALLAIEHAWRASGGQFSATVTSFSAFDQLQDERFDAVILNAIDEAKAALALAGALRRSAHLYHLPILTIGAAQSAIADQARERGAFAGEADNFASAAAWLAEDVARARQRKASMAILRAAPEASSPWPLAVFTAHLEAVARSHQGGGRTLTLGHLRLGAGPPRQPSWRARFAELAGLAGRLIRASDCVAALDEASLVFAFPCTDEAGARAALARIVSVWGHTAFVAETGAGLSCRQDAIELAPGESGAALLARLRDGQERG